MITQLFRRDTIPTYTFKHKESKEEFTVIISIAEREQYLKENPHMEQTLAKPVLGDSARLGLAKPDQGFRDRLKDIKKTHYGSNINTW